ncbi:hypothetical protein V8G54_006530 [Vigna mungo]|uniref:Mitochondrial protein n=1 Tax=Vigna mungo TaxID=3915 RepID=A0AAQ3P3H2_VIGMU
MQARRDKNLCFNCDEWYTRGHRCKPQFLLFTCFDTDDASTDLTIDGSVPEPHEPEATLISLHAFSSQWSPHTFRVIWSINVYSVQILLNIDSPIDLYPLDLSGTNVVLRAHRVQLISPFHMDYNGPFMRFMWNNSLMELQDNQDPNSIPISSHQLKRLQTTNRVEALFQLSLQPLPPTPLSYPHNTTFDSEPTLTHLLLPNICEPQLQGLISKYSSLFTIPTALPPSRPTDHSINLTPNSSPIFVSPYRYPHFQMHEIESQVQKMLDSDFIVSNNSPFSSPVLLVKKKDDT